MAKPPESTKTSLRQRLDRPRARTLAPARRHHRPLPRRIRLRRRPAPRRHRAAPVPAALRRLRHTWGFAIYRASHDDYEDSILPSGYPAGTPQEALDCACGLYLNDPTAWLTQPPPTN